MMLAEKFTEQAQMNRTAQGPFMKFGGAAVSNNPFEVIVNEQTIETNIERE